MSTGISDFFQNTSLFGFAVASWSARRTSSKVVGIAKDSIVLNVKDGLVTVGMKVIPGWFAIVTDLFLAFFAYWELGCVAATQFGRVVGWVEAIVADIEFDIKEIKRRLQFSVLIN